MAKKKQEEPNEEPHEPLPEGLRPEDVFRDAEPEKASAIEDVEFEGKSLSGDVRDILLGHIRSMSKPWAMMSENEQRDKIHAITETGKHVVRGVVSVVTRNKFPVMNVIIGAWKVDKALEIKIGCSPSVQNVTMLASHSGGSAVLILAEASDYFGERAPAKPEKDQPSLPLEKQDED